MVKTVNKPLTNTTTKKLLQIYAVFMCYKHTTYYISGTN